MASITSRPSNTCKAAAAPATKFGPLIVDRRDSVPLRVARAQLFVRSPMRNILNGIESKPEPPRVERVGLLEALRQAPPIGTLCIA
jgi:hypothetical protein